MKNLFRRLRQLADKSTNGVHAPEEVPLDLGLELKAIRAAEQDGAVEPGKRIHSFPFQELDLRLDRDVLGQYRVTVWAGRERRYGFTIRCARGDYHTLESGFDEIIDFLQGERRVTALPNHDAIRGHYYGS